MLQPGSTSGLACWRRGHLHTCVLSPCARVTLQLNSQRASQARHGPTHSPEGVLLRAQGPQLTMRGRAWRTAASWGSKCPLHHPPWPGTRLHPPSSGLAHSPLRLPREIAPCHRPNKFSMHTGCPRELSSSARSWEGKSYTVHLAQVVEKVHLGRTRGGEALTAPATPSH